MRGRLSLYIVLPVVAVLLPFTSVSITDQILSYGYGRTCWSSSSSRSRLGAFTASRQNDTCEAENICSYSTSIRTSNFPHGEFILVAIDPLSGATALQPVTIYREGEGTKDFFRKYDQDLVFGLVSGVLAAFLVAVLAVLVGKKESTWAAIGTTGIEEMSAVDVKDACSRQEKYWSTGTHILTMFRWRDQEYVS